jgi:hypothetical protein
VRLRSLLLVGLLALVAFQVWWFKRETPTERRLAKVAEEIARADVAVRCPSIWARLLDISSFQGTAHFDGEGRATHAKLKHEICATFDRLAGDGFPDDLSCLDKEGACDGWRLDVATAIHVLAHESWHLAGVFDESETECYAIQTDAEVAARFGASPEAGDAIARYAERMNPRISLPEYRISTNCRDGGPLDLAPDAEGWPTARR